MLNGKYWLIPGGRVVDVTLSEHAIYARKEMLGLPCGNPSVSHGNMLCPLTPSEIVDHRRRGVTEDVLSFLSVDSQRSDPRVYAINSWNWIRARFIEMDSPGFWLRSIDDATLRTIRSASDFWLAQKQLTDFDMINVTELSTGDCYEISVLRLRDQGMSASQLLAKAFKKPNYV